MKKKSLYLFAIIFIQCCLLGCKKEDIAASLILGNWRVTKVDVVLNETVTPISVQVFERNYKNVQHTFNEDKTYIFTDFDGSITEGTWQYLVDTKEIVITYPKIDYEERFEVLTNTIDELILKTPTVDIEKANSDQDFEILFTSNILLINTPAQNIEPKSISIMYQMAK